MAESLDASADDGANVQEEKRRGKASGSGGYPFGPLFFIITAAVSQSYAATGLQAILELYFVRFLYVCSGKRRAEKLGTSSVNTFIAIYQLFALSGGFLADKLIGNYMTQNFSNVLIALGACLISFSSWQLTVREPSCCPPSPNLTSLGLALGNSSINCTAIQKDILLPSVDLHIPPSLNMVLVILGLLLFAVGYGHTNTIQSVFVADQFSDENSKAKKRSFSWYYLFVNVGSLAGEGGMPVLRQTVGFVISVLTVAGTSVASAIVFFAGVCLYRRKPPNKLHLCGRCSTRDTKKSDCLASNSSKETDLLLRSDDKTKNGTKTEAKNSQNSSVVTRQCCYEGFRQLLPLVGVFAPLVVYWAVFFQQNSTWIVQGTRMNCYLGTLHLPPDFMPSIEDLMVILSIPLLDYVVYPHLERVLHTSITSIHKLACGMVCAALSFLMSALLQLYLREAPEQSCHGDVNITWQLPQLFLIALAEVLVSVTGLEFAYSQAPPGLRNIVTAMWYITQSLGTLLNAAIAQISISLTAQFFIYTALMGLVTVAFVAINRKYKPRNS